MDHQRTTHHANHIHRQQDDWDEVHNQLLAIQKKSLEVSNPNDADEKEADEVGKKVASGESVGIHGTGGTINRKGEGAAETTPGFQTKLESNKGGGHSLDDATRSEMESKMGADLGGVKIHTGSEANAMNESVNAKAFAHGQDVFFKQGEFDTGSKQGKELLAHELTHTVQQGSGKVQTKIQRFEGEEHKAIGDVGSANTRIKLNNTFSVSFGDITALAGDWFGTVEQIKKIGETNGSYPVKTPEEILTLSSTVLKKDLFNKTGTTDEINYALIVGVLERTEFTDYFSESVRTAADSRGDRLLPTNWSHFTNPVTGDSEKTHNEKAKMIAAGTPINNAAAYRMNHEKAIKSALAAGKAGTAKDEALLLEAFASHFLTDAYASGHTRVERYSIKKYWDNKYPLFWINAQWWIAERLAEYLKQHGSNTTQMVTTQYIFETALGIVKEKVGGMPEMSFGDLIGGAMHDYDNKYGVYAKVGSKPAVRLMGDRMLTPILGQKTGKTLKSLTPTADEKAAGETFDLAAAAVTTSLKDVNAAYDKGKAGQTDFTKVQTELKGESKMYAAELSWPQALPDTDKAQKNPKPQWKADTFDKLISESTAATDAINIFMKNNMSSMEAKVLPTLEDDDQKEAFKTNVTGRLMSKSVASIKEILTYYPGMIAETWGGWADADKDETIGEYFDDVNAKGQTKALNYTQRLNMIKPIMDGSFVQGKDDQVVSYTITSAPADEQRKLIIACGGWRKIYDALHDDECSNFVLNAGPNYWKAASYDEKWKECHYILEGIIIGDEYIVAIKPSEIGQKVIMTILRSDPTHIINQLLNVDFSFKKNMDEKYGYEIDDLVTPK